MSVLSIDLAQKRYTDVGVCSLRTVRSEIEVTPIRLATRDLTGSPTTKALAKTVIDLAEELGARLVIIDGPQAWKSPENGLLHSRVCERRLATQGKTGLPGHTKPANYAPFIAFSIDLFDQLTESGWARLPNESALPSGSRFALESFPTSAWRSLGLRPLPGKANTPVGAVQAKVAELSSLLPIKIQPGVDLSHDELQALVAGLAGIAIEGYSECSFSVSGDPPLNSTDSGAKALSSTRCVRPENIAGFKFSKI